ncbi:FecR family protein [Labilibacter marinus]|uniref:FecR family protein n=1 Tax=Labilibacter marinus TaxID=1477105 RepID=UPI00117AF70E|nr:FecR domain-containing protein [Labilibacter marinus]
MMKKKQNIDWELAARVHSGEASKSEMEQFDAWAKVPEHKAEWDQLVEQLGQVDHALVAEKVNIDLAWEKVKGKTKQKTRRVKMVSKMWYSAVAASVIVAFTLFLNPFEKSATLQHLVVNETMNNQEEVNLADGSMVDLNRHSSIQYPETFNDNTRMVTLDGEAFFDVAADKNKPFLIDAGQIQVKVVGTSFNVKAYADSEYKEVSVKSGVVQVLSQMGDKPIVVLEAGDKAVFNVKNNSLIKMKSEGDNYLAWKTKDITFKKENLKDAISLLEDVYNVEIDIPDNFKLDSAEISATFHKNSIDFILDVLDKTYNVDFKIVEKD